jgi:hypothetical protein
VCSNEALESYEIEIGPERLADQLKRRLAVMRVGQNQGDSGVE